MRYFNPATHRLAATALAASFAAVSASAAFAQAPKAAGETVNIQNYQGTTGNMHAIVAEAKGLCDKYNFKCAIKAINSTSVGLQALVGKSIDVTQGGADLTAAAVAAGADVKIVGTSLPASVLSVSTRNDVPLPSKAKGYPEIMKDFKGLKVGVSARGTSSEWLFNTMLADGGLKPSDVTYVAIGGPATAYTALVVGKQIDAVIMFQPLTQLCRFNKNCDTVVDMTIGEGPAKVKAQDGASVIFAMRGDMVAANPQLVASIQAAFRDAAVWFNDPANFEELVKIYTPLISFGDLPGADQLRRDWIKSVLFAYSKDLKVGRAALKSIIDYNIEAGLISKPVAVEDVVTSATP